LGQLTEKFLKGNSEIQDIRNKTTEKSQEARDELQKSKDDTLRESSLKKINATSKAAEEELRRSKPLFEELLRIL